VTGINIFDIASREGAKRFERLNFLAWCERYIKLIIGGELAAFSLDGHPDLYEMYTLPMVPRETHQKAAQRGISTLCLLRVLWLLDRMAMKAVYYFPTDEDVKDFSQDRGNPLIDNSEYLSSKMQYDKADNLGLKQIGLSSLYFRGVWTKRKVKSIDADIIIKDELDEADQENMIFAEDRLLHSIFKYIIELSQPSRPDFGINKSFKKSDMRYLMIKCPACGRWNNVVESFPKNLFSSGRGDRFKAWIGCTRCKRDLNMKTLNLKRIEWVPKHPERSKDHRGWQESQLFSSTIDGKFIYDKYTGAILTSEKKNFWISIVGVPYRDSELCPITESLIESMQGDRGFEKSAMSSFMGIDVGDVCHVVVLGWTGYRLRVIHLAEVLADDEKGFYDLVETYKSYFVIDAMPYKNLAKKLAMKYRGWGAIQYFKGEALREKTEGEGEYEVAVVMHDRTESIDEMVDMAREGFFVLPDPKRLKPHELELYERFVFQLKNLEKEKIMDKKGYEKTIYKKNVANHFGMALNSAFIAFRTGRGHFCPDIDPVVV